MMISRENMTEITQKIRTRFAPSPTGFVHIGSLRTELFNFLFTRHNNGTHVLRIEDTDQNRLVPGAVENLLNVVNGLGITFDEGPRFDNGQIVEQGSYGPYVQSVRKNQGIYAQYVQQLIQQKDAYYCFCSEERLEELRAEQIALKKPPMYDRLCRRLSEAEVEQKLAENKAANKNFVVRQSIPLDGVTEINDLIYGRIVIENKTLDDQVLLKSDGFPTYHLAVVVDDHLMEITHVIRAPEWIPSTPKHLLLYKAFGWEPTEFAHVPLVINKDKTKLAKRQGDVAVEDFLKKGYLKEALVNFMAFLGWNPKTEQEIFSLDELIAQFDLKNVNRASSVFDLDKLDWMNGQYIRNMPIGELVNSLIPFWQVDQSFELDGNRLKITNLDLETKKNYLIAITELEKERLKKLSEIGERTVYFFNKPNQRAIKELLVAKKSTPELTRQGLTGLIEVLDKLEHQDFSKETLEDKVKEYISASGLGNFDVLWPMRVALTGLSASPSPFEVASVLGSYLGKQEVVNRLKAALSNI